MKIKKIILLLLVFVVSFGAIYIVTKTNERQRVDVVLKESIKNLQTHYEILLYYQKISAKTIHLSTIKLKNFTRIMKEANSADKEQKKLLRQKLQKLLQDKYEIIKLENVFQYHFVLANNESFLRMHKPSKFGDDLTNVRKDYRYVNEFKKPIRGFVQGRITHGFRNTFPLFDGEGNHIGAMEVSFSSDSIQQYLNNVSNIHTHLLIHQDIFDANTWIRDDLVLKYFPSAEHEQYKIAFNHSNHTVKSCIEENSIRLNSHRQEIDRGIKSENPFSIYIEDQGYIYIVSFMPVKSLDHKAMAWLVSYEKSEFIALTLEGGEVIRIVSFLVLLLLVYSIAKQISSKEKIKKEHNLLNEVLSTTEDSIFVTNFKEIVFSNKKFKELLNIEHSSDYGKNVLDIFVVADGYLHRELLGEGESFIRLIQRTPENERVVSIIDKHFSIKAFKVDIVQINYTNNDDYLVTLTDITTMKERQVQTEKKAYFDGLTNVYNRHKFDEIIKSEIRDAQRYHRILSMAILDIDKFKNFNDVYGHLIGDEVLIMLAQYVKNSIRESDVFARWGGEEFVILFKEMDAKQAKILSEKIREGITKLEHETAGNISASFGVTEFREGDTLESMFKRCDDALYIAKESGRNRVEVL